MCLMGEGGSGSENLGIKYFTLGVMKTLWDVLGGYENFALWLWRL